MSESSLTSAFVRLINCKDDDRNFISAAFHVTTITLITMSLVDLSWFTITVDTNVLNVGQFFDVECSGADINCSDYDLINSTVITLIRTIVILCVMVIIFSLTGFFFDIIVVKCSLYKMIRKYAIFGTCAVLWITAVISVSYNILLSLEDSLVQSSVKGTVSYSYGFYFLASAGGIALVGVCYNLILAHHPVWCGEDDDACLIGYDDDLHHPSPPPPYNEPPPPYTP